MKPIFEVLLLAACCISAVHPVTAADWPRFLGPAGDGISGDAAIPRTWSESENLAWRAPLPGPGSSSPVVCGDRVFVTCYSGYGVPDAQNGGKSDLKRHLVCLGLTDGQIFWTKTIVAEMPEDDHAGYLTEHGYASSTPVTDGKQVFVFFGKRGVLAFDMDGDQQWRVAVGKESRNRRWGSAASPVLYNEMVIVNAAEEIQAAADSLKKLDKNSDGKLTYDELQPQMPGGRPGLAPQGGPKGPGMHRPGGPGSEGPKPGRPQGPPAGGRQGPGAMQGPGGPGSQRPGGPPSPEQFVEHAMQYDADQDGKLNRDELRKFAERFARGPQSGGRPGEPGGRPDGEQPARPRRPAIE